LAKAKKKVSDFALRYLQGMNDAGVLGCLKHFPGVMEIPTSIRIWDYQYWKKI
jgi:hypothetical protein